MGDQAESLDGSKKRKKNKKTGHFCENEEVQKRCCQSRITAPGQGFIVESIVILPEYREAQT